MENWGIQQLAYGRFDVVDRQFFDAREGTLEHQLCDTFSSVRTCQTQCVRGEGSRRTESYPHHADQSDAERGATFMRVEALIETRELHEHIDDRLLSRVFKSELRNLRVKG